MTQQNPEQARDLQNPIGYGSSTLRHSARIPNFDGDERKFELWEIKFLGGMRIKNLHNVFKNIENEEQQIDADQNEQAFAELVQLLDDRSLSLIIREARDNGRKALQILRQHYLPKGKPRIITLYTELTSLSKLNSEDVTDYIIRAETYASSLRDAGETISDSLLVAMTIKGLPSPYAAFTTVITQKTSPVSFTDFKIALRNFEDTQKIQCVENQSVMNFNDNFNSQNKNKRWCTQCKSNSHDTAYCYKKNNPRGATAKWCSFCKSSTHDTDYCYSRKGKQKFKKKNNHAKCLATKKPATDDEDEHSFAFTLDSSGGRCDHQTPAEVKADCVSYLIDSGASVHILKDSELFVRFKTDFRPEQHVIELADGAKVSGIAKGQGDAMVTLHDAQGKPHDVILENALFIPTFTQEILSVPALTQNGASISFSGESGTIRFKEHENIEFQMNKSKNLYFVNVVKTSSRSLEEWHKVLGHCNFKDVIALENCVDGMKINKNNTNFECQTCILGKMTQSFSREPVKSAKNVFDMINVDLAGPIEPAAEGGFKYALICTDHFSNLTSTYLLKAKSDSVLAFNMYLADIAPYGKIKRLRSDQGGEFISEDFEKVLIENKIKHEKSAPFSPHQNGKAERGWRTLFSMARCLLIEAKLPKTMWSYALKAAAYIRNRCLNKRIGMTPFEAVTKRKPNLKHMHVFGQTCFAFVNNPKKLDDRAKRGIFVGYDRDSPAFLVFFPPHEAQTYNHGAQTYKSGQIRKVRNVKFLGQQPFYREQCHQEHIQNSENKENDDFIPMIETQGIPIEPIIDSDNDTQNVNTTEQNLNPKRVRNRPKHLNDFYVDTEVDEHLNATHHYIYVVNSDIPTSYNEALSCKDSEEWKVAMNNEFKALENNDTYELTELPPNRQMVGGRWVYDIKTGLDDNKTFKARYVAKGYSQTPLIDYNETFAPTARMTSIRLLIHIAAQKGLNIHQMDVKSAYLNAPIDKEIYVQQPQGFEINDKDGKPLVWKLKKSLYGLKQSGRNWNETLNMHLSEQGFKQSINDPCIYCKISSIDCSYMYLLANVDDLLIFGRYESEIDRIKLKLDSTFKMKDLGEIKYYLGIEFEVKTDSILMSQTKYIDQILITFGMQDCKPKYTPCEMNLNRLYRENDPLSHDDAVIYRQIVGSLIYLMSCTRPDLSFVVTSLSQFMSNPNAGSMIIAKHVLRYIKGTKENKLCFSKIEGNMIINGFCDADWASSEDRKSITGYCFQLSNHGPLISWKSRKQPTVALSTCEAEYMSLVSAIQEGKYLKSLIIEVTGFNLDFELNCDNQGTIALAKNPVKHQRTKHIDIKYHFIREEICNGYVNVVYIPTDKNVADTFTKPISKIKLTKFRNQLFGILT